MDRLPRPDVQHDEAVAEVPVGLFEDLVAAGRDTECKALSNAVKWHCEGRVILQGNRTVVLR